MADNTEWKDVLVYIEISDDKPQEVGWELLGQATRLAGKLGQKVSAMIIGDGVKKFAYLFFSPHEFALDSWQVILVFAYVMNKLFD
mgnify:CR=1 FL=1